MKRLISPILILVLLLSLCGCVNIADTTEYKWTGEELFGLPEQASSYTLRHAGESKLYLNFERGDRCAAYQSVLRQLPLNPTSKEGSMDADIYEITTDYFIFDDIDNTVEEFTVKLIVSGDMVLYNDQWYEANTSQLLRQLKRDFANE